MTIGLGLLALRALVGGVLLRRRRDGGTAVLATVDPDAPAATDAIDVELHEMIAEASAQRLLSEPAGDEREPVESR